MNYSAQVLFHEPQSRFWRWAYRLAGVRYSHVSVGLTHHDPDSHLTVVVSLGTGGLELASRADFERNTNITLTQPVPVPFGWSEIPLRIDRLASWRVERVRSVLKWLAPRWFKAPARNCVTAATFLLGIRHHVHTPDQLLEKIT